LRADVARVHPGGVRRRTGTGQGGGLLGAWPLCRRRRRTVLGGVLTELDWASCCSGSPGSSVPATGSPSPSSASRPRASILLAHCSHAGENYYYGDRIDLKVGNTQVLARIISQRLNDQGVACDVHRIGATDP